MDGHGERSSPKEAPNNAEMLLALLSHSEELRKGKRDSDLHHFDVLVFIFFFFSSIRVFATRWDAGCIRAPCIEIGLELFKGVISL